MKFCVWLFGDLRSCVCVDVCVCVCACKQLHSRATYFHGREYGVWEVHATANKYYNILSARRGCCYNMLLIALFSCANLVGRSEGMLPL